MPHEHEDNLTAAQEELAGALGWLRPARIALDRDEVMFRAGLASARRRDRRWGAGMACLTFVLGATTGLLAFRAPEAGVVQRVVYRERSESPPLASVHNEAAPLQDATCAAPRGEYLRLRQAVLEKGLDALPSFTGHVEKDDLRDLLPSSGRPIAPAQSPDGIEGFFSRRLNGDRS